MPEKTSVTRNPVIRGLKFCQYAAAVGVGEYWSRRDFAQHFGVSMSTAQYHADRAVEQGILVRSYGWIENQPGYLYSLNSGEG